MTPVEESNHQFAKAWQWMASASPKAVMAEPDGLKIVCAGVSIPMFNAAVPTARVPDLETLEQRVNAARTFLKAHGMAGVFALCDDWAPAGAARWFASREIPVSMHVTGMAADSLLPSRYSPGGLDIRPLRGEEGAITAAEVNAAAYGMPRDSAGEIAFAGLWEPPAHGYAVHVDGKPVAVGAFVMIDHIAYVAWMATLPKYGRRGYAEALIRQGLAEAAANYGITRSVLHASRPGLPVYRRLGYEVVTGFPLYLIGARDVRATANAPAA